MGEHYVALSRREGTYMYWPIELERYVLKSGWVTAIHGMEFISKGGVKIWHLWWDESIGLFCIGRNEFGFHLDGELNRDGWHCICTFHILHVLLEMTKPNNDILFVFFEYFDCTENIVRIWICIVTWKIKPFSICFALVLPAESSQKCTKESWEDRRIHFVTSEEGTLFDIDRRSLVRLSLNDDSESNVLKGIQNWSCWQIWGRHHESCFGAWNVSTFFKHSNLFKQTNHVLM